MTRSKAARSALVGAAESGSNAVLVTLSHEFELLDRRQIELVEPGLPTHPHHHEGSWALGRYLKSPWARPITLAEAVELVERVRASAHKLARAHLAALRELAPDGVAKIALRACQPVPATIEAAIADARAQTYADSVMYRRALASAAEELGWGVAWYDNERVEFEAAAALRETSLEAHLRELGRKAGPPWQARHKLAAMAAIAAR